MLTDEKRKKLLAGTLIAVMLTGVAGCGSNKDSEWKNDNSAQNNQDENKDENNGGGFFHGFRLTVFIHLHHLRRLRCRWSGSCRCRCRFCQSCLCCPAWSFACFLQFPAAQKHH